MTFLFILHKLLHIIMEMVSALRDAQRQVASFENTAMVVTLDIGNPDNIHPAKNMWENVI